jgi:predicted DCC family thiol-disulfide oxidoreductase YuxK
MGSPSLTESAEALVAQLPARVIFFDGVCGFCDRTVRLLLDRDTAGRLHYAMLQGETARVLRESYPEAFPGDLDTMVYLDNTGDQPRFLLRSQASFAIAREVGSLRRWAWLSRLPPWLPELAYRVFAALRYRLFGKLDSCRIPSPNERARFLD